MKLTALVIGIMSLIAIAFAMSTVLLPDTSLNQIGLQAFLLIPLAALCFIAMDNFFRRSFDSRFLSRVRMIVFIALAIRTAVLFAVILSTKGTAGIFAAFDDESYHYFAKGFNLFSSARPNYYCSFLALLYKLFGASTVVGRMVNIILGVLTIYPLAYLGIRVFDEAKWLMAGLTAYAILPYQVFWCCFEIKDCLFMFILMYGMAIICGYKFREKHFILSLALITVLSLAADGIRRSTGLLLFSSFLLEVTGSRLQSNRAYEKLKGLWLFLIFIFGLFLVRQVLYAYASEHMIEKALWYQLWGKGGEKEFAARSFFLIDSINQVWKAPLSFMIYILSPLPYISERAGRFMLDFGGYLKIFEQPLIVLAMLGLPRLIKRLGFALVPAIVSLASIAFWSVANFRHGIAFLPLLYLAGVLAYSRSRYPKTLLITAAVLAAAVDLLRIFCFIF